MSTIATTPRKAPRVDARKLAVWRSFLKSHAGLAATLARELEEERGLPLAWYGVLLSLSEALEGRMRLQELAGAVFLSFSGLTRLLDRIEAAGLVTRQPCPEDRRGLYAEITPAGRRAFRRAAAVHLRGIQEHFARHITDEEAAVLESALGKVAAAASTSQPGCCQDSE